MAYQDELDQQNQAKASAGGILAGSGGAANAPTSKPAGSGFTNLQQYLSANQGQGQGIAKDIVAEGQKGVAKAQTAADAQADAWVNNAGIEAAAGSQEALANQANSIAQVGNADASYMTPQTYKGPNTAQDVAGYNDLDAAYANVKKTADNYASDYDTQKAGLQNKYGYGSGFAALDTFLGRQDGKDTIQGWSNGIQPASKDGKVAQANEAIAAERAKVEKGNADYKKAYHDNKVANTINTKISTATTDGTPFIPTYTKDNVPLEAEQPPQTNKYGWSY